MKRHIILPSILLVASLTGCNQENKPASLSFEKDTYEVYSGQAVTLVGNTEGVTYEIVSDNVEGISLDANTGVFTFSNDIPNYSQVMYVAKRDGKISEPTVVTLIWEYSTPEISWLGEVKSIADGGYVLAKTNNSLAIKYELAENYRGISVNETTGRVSISSLATEGDEFVVKASSYDAVSEKTFKVARTNLAKSLTKSQCCESGNLSNVSFKLDFSEVPEGYEKDVIGILAGDKIIDSSYFAFNKTSNTLILYKQAFNDFVIGETNIGIITARNTILVKVIKASKFIKTAEDLAAINESRDALSGYYVLANDIDLTSYLTSNKWLPIGLYHDTTDGTALVDSFNGVFDGNGHVVSGLRLARTDEYAFNSGLFGYVNSAATIKNLGVIMNQSTQSVVYSYSGGFVGVNNGVIENCWINFNIRMDSSANRVLGGFAGRNFNIIKNSYAYGSIGSGTTVGAFCGQNGEVGVSGILKNCYATGGSAFAGGGTYDESNLYFNTLEDLKANNYGSYGEEYWTVENGALPVLKTQIDFNYPYEISFTNKKEHIDYGTNLTLGLDVKPEKYVSEYDSLVEIICDDPNTPINNRVAAITSASAEKITFTATLQTEIGELTDRYVIYTHPAFESAEIVDDLPSKLEPGKKYRLNHIITPEKAYDDAKWTLNPSLISGVTIKDDILTITEDVKKYSGTTFKVNLTIQGHKYEKTLTINKINYLSTKVYVYSDSTETTFSFTLPDEADLTGMELYRYSKRIQYTLEGHKVVIPVSVIAEVPGAEMPFTFRLNDGTLYKGYAMYVIKKTYDPANVPADAIAINSVADFKRYFNVSDYQSSRYGAYYNKNFVLTADLDFGNETLCGIGTSEKPFTGKIYGQGHTLKNINVSDHEGYWSLSAAQREEKYRESKYSVGFFGTLDGTIQDVIFKNLNVRANNYCGTLAGKIGKNGLVQNVEFVDCSVENIAGKNYSEGEMVTGLIAGVNSGVLDGVTYNGEPVME